MSLLRRSLRPGVGASVPVARPTWRLPTWLRRTAAAVLLAAWLARRGGRLTVWLARHPALMLTAAVLAGACWVVARVGWWPVGLVAGITSITAGIAEEYRPGTLRRVAAGPALSSWRRLWTYRRHWQPALVTAGLALSHGGVERLPRLGRVRSTPAVDVVRVRMLPGQTVEQWSKVAEQLAVVFGVRQVRARAVPGRVQDVELRCMVGDPLTDPVPLPAAAGDDVDLTAVPVGVREDGGILTLPLLHSHLLVGGATGSGKGSVIWSLLTSVAPAIRGGTVKVWGIDLKGGMELGRGADLFDRPDRLVHGSAEQAAELLELAVAGMRDRAARLRAKGIRKLIPGDPEQERLLGRREALLVIVVDELASVLAYVTDPKLRRRLSDALALLLSQGRAVGVCVVGATQDVRKETIGLRDLFPVRVGLRTAEAEAADMLLGRGARDRGALTDRIPYDLPGVGYVLDEDAGVPEPVRGRFWWVDDAAIDRVVAECRRAA